MTEEMAQYHELPEKLWKYCDFPFKSVNYGVRAWLSLHLNPQRTTFGPQKGNLQDWRGVAEVLGFAPIQILNFERSNDSLGEVMKNLHITKQDAKLGDVLMAILRCERYDVLEDTHLMMQLDKCKHSDPYVYPVVAIQDPYVGSSNDMNGYLTVGEAETESPEFFNAFVCYSISDLPFVRYMMTELEDRQQFKLCIPDRDCLAGPSKYEAITKLIQERCDKFIVILSPDFTKSEECTFMLNFTHSLNPNARLKKLIPILYKKCEIPPILSFITLVDFTRADVIDWFWNRLSKSLKSSLNTSLSSNSISSIIEPPVTIPETSVNTFKTVNLPDNFVEIEKTPLSASSVAFSPSEEQIKQTRKQETRPLVKEEEDFFDISTEVASVPFVTVSSFKPFSFTQRYKGFSKK